MIYRFVFAALPLTLIPFIWGSDAPLVWGEFEKSMFSGILGVLSVGFFLEAVEHGVVSEDDDE